MRIAQREFEIRSLNYTIRTACEQDAEQLSAVRLQIDGETENLNREPGEDFIDVNGFKHVIQTDTEHPHCLFLVVETNGQIVGFARCVGTELKRMAHQVEFGICIMEKYWGYKIGSNLLEAAIDWADNQDIQKMTLAVLETNEPAIRLYKKVGFEVEGILKRDKRLSDGRFYNTILMARFHEGRETTSAYTG